MTRTRSKLGGTTHLFWKFAFQKAEMGITQCWLDFPASRLHDSCRGFGLNRCGLLLNPLRNCLNWASSSRLEPILRQIVDFETHQISGINIRSRFTKPGAIGSIGSTAERPWKTLISEFSGHWSGRIYRRSQRLLRYLHWSGLSLCRSTPVLAH